MTTTKNPPHFRAVYDWSETSIRLIASPSELAKSMFFHVQEVGHFQSLPHYLTERENLPSFLVVYTLSGTGYLTYRGIKYTLQPEQAFFIHCMDYHYYETDKVDLWELLWVHFSGEASRHYFEQYIQAGDPVVSLPMNTTVPGFIQELIRLHQAKDIRTELQSSKVIVNLLTELLLQNIEKNRASSSRFLPDYIQAIQQYLDKHLANKVTLTQLSQTFSISKFHLAREFKRYSGLTPNEYLIHQRLNKAKDFLKYSQVPIAEIANQVGFENISYFINQFKRQEGTTPLNFRKAWQRPK